MQLACAESLLAGKQPGRKGTGGLSKCEQAIHLCDEESQLCAEQDWQRISSRSRELIPPSGITAGSTCGLLIAEEKWTSWGKSSEKP